MTPTLGWALVGCGWVARDYVAPAIRASRNGRLVAVCDPSAGARDAVADGDTATFDTLAACLAHPGVGAVYVATPNHLHADQTIAALRAGIPVLCEKPMATSAADAARMVAASDETGVLLATAFDQRFHAGHRLAARLVRGGTLGTLTQVRLHYACWVGADWSADNWRVDPARAGGGAVIDLAPHGIDLVEAVTGRRWLALSGHLQRAAHGYPSGVDDGGILVGRLEGDALAVLQVGYHCPEAFPRRTLEILGTAGRLLLEDTMGQTPGGRVTLQDHWDGTRVLPLEDDRSPFLVQAEAFAAAVLESRPYPYPAADDLRRFRLLEDACATPR